MLDTTAADFLDDPHRVFDRLRAGGEPVRDSLGWSLLTYAACEQAFLDPALSPGIDAVLTDLGIGHLWGEPGHTLTDSEGVDHRRLRRAVSPWFAPRRIEALRSRTRGRVDALMAGRRDVDVMTEIAEVVPAELFCWMVGAPVGDAPQLATWSKTLLQVFTADPAMVGPVRAAKESMAHYAAALFDAKRRRPGDDLTSLLLRAVDDGDLDAPDAFFLMEELLSAAVDNTANTAATALWTLAGEPAAWSALRADADLVARAVEECGRYEPAIRHTIKVATADTAVAGRLVAAGEFVTLRLAAAHRDPAVYERPHVFDHERVQPAPQLAFGAGRHYCLGAALGRMEVQEIVGGVLRAWPAVEVDPQLMGAGPRAVRARALRHGNGLVEELGLRESA